MATRVEKDASGRTIYYAAESRKVPNLDLLTFLFESPYCAAQEDTLVHVYADNPSISVNKAQARELLKATAYTLRRSFGIGAKGPNQDVISCILPGHTMVGIVFFATIACGGVFSAASTTSTPTELARQMKLGSSKLLICNDVTKDIAMAAAKEYGLSEDRILLLGDGPEIELKSAASGKTVPTGEGELQWQRITDPKELEESLICLIYSSGTTGLPKGVQLSHKNIVSSAHIAVEPMKEFNRVHRPDFKYRTIGHLPVNHIAGIQGALVNPMVHGGPVYWMPRFEFSKLLEHCKKYQVTHFFSVPPIFLLIAKSPDVTDHFDSVVGAVAGAAPLGKDLQYAASQKLGKGEMFITQTWGLSETTGSITLLPQGWQDDSGSVSCLIANCSARIIDDNGKDVPVGSRGEIICKGPVVTKGYHNNPKANEEAFQDGWFCTGDVAEFRNGMFYIVDRKKELIKYKGEQVAPAELEALLLSHDHIQDAAVIGVEGEGTEVPRAYVVADQKKVSEQEIKDYVKKNVAHFKQLRGGVIFLDAIPKSPSGKILRKDLRELAKKENRAKL